MKLYDEHKDLRDKFEIVAIHDSGVKTFAELDEKLVKIKKQYWEDKDLPFAVLIDDDNQTVKAYGVNWFPTSLLIDPQGKVVAGEAAEMLEAKLAELSGKKREPGPNGP